MSEAKQRKGSASPTKGGKADKSKEPTGLKRSREGSLEPAPKTTPAQTKKNRLASGSGDAAKPSTIPEQPDGTDTDGDVASAVKSTKKETRNVGEVRKKVERLSHGGEGEGEEPATDAAAASGETDAKEDESSEAEAAAEGSAEQGLKRKAPERSESALNVEDWAKRPKDDVVEAEDPKAQASATADKTDASSSAEKPAAPAAVPAKKPQSTFGAFASSASPFGARAGAASPFAAAGAAGSSSKPSGSVFGSGAKTGFGGYSSTASPFAGKAAAAAAASDPEKKATKSDEGKGKAGEAEAEAEDTGAKKAGGSTFGGLLSSKGADEKTDESDKPRMTEQDVSTGEEGEETVYQTRAKLYVSQPEGGWRERGVGLLKLNVRESDGKAPRLIMRAEGVLRLILNVSLYAGQTCLEDGKHVRTTVFEEGERRFVTFRTGSTKTADELCEVIREHIPLEPKAAAKTDSAV